MLSVKNLKIFIFPFFYVTSQTNFKIVARTAQFFSERIESFHLSTSEALKGLRRAEMYKSKLFNQGKCLSHYFEIVSQLGELIFILTSLLLYMYIYTLTQS